MLPPAASAPEADITGLYRQLPASWKRHSLIRETRCVEDLDEVTFYAGLKGFSNRSVAVVIDLANLAHNSVICRFVRR